MIDFLGDPMSLPLRLAVLSAFVVIAAVVGLYWVDSAVDRHVRKTLSRKGYQMDRLPTLPPERDR